MKSACQLFTRLPPSAPSTGTLRCVATDSDRSVRRLSRSRTKKPARCAASKTSQHKYLGFHHFVFILDNLVFFFIFSPHSSSFSSSVNCTCTILGSALLPSLNSSIVSRSSWRQYIGDKDKRRQRQKKANTKTDKYRDWTPPLLEHLNREP